MTPGTDGTVAEQVLRVQRAAYAVEAALIGDDRIPALRETLADLRAAPLHWLGAFGAGREPAGPPDAAPARIHEPGRPREPAGRLVGAVAWTEDATMLDIDRLVVDPAAHRRGVGRALVDAVLARGGDRRVLVATGRANRPARALYESSGFIALGDEEPVPGLWITRYALTPRPGPDRAAPAS